MALNYKTYYAIPQLRTYADAKAHYDNIIPIRRDPHGTRPVGRRDQKWFNIWMEKDDVHVGYGWSPGSRQSIVSYQPGGTITIPNSAYCSSASTNERLTRLLGPSFEIFQYDTWVRCVWYDNGELKSGKLPVQHSRFGNWGPNNLPTDNSIFTRTANGELLFLNYRYPKTHTINRAVMREAYAPYAEFVEFVEAIRRLHGTEYLRFSDETRAEFFGWHEYNSPEGTRRFAKSGPHLVYGENVEENRELFLAWARSDDGADRMRAAITMSSHRYLDAPGIKRFMTNFIVRQLKEKVLTEKVCTDGTLVKDRYRRFL